MQLLVASIPTVFDKLRENCPGLWHFMGLNPLSIRGSKSGKSGFSLKCMALRRFINFGVNNFLIIKSITIARSNMIANIPTVLDKLRVLKTKSIVYIVFFS
jgi:hypothetical protein